VGFYEDRIVPHLVNWAMRNRRLHSYRERVTSAAEGRVSPFAAVLRFSPYFCAGK
jgi:hypothetical protein